MTELTPIEPYRFFRFGALHLPAVAKALFGLADEPLLVIEEVNALENAIRRLPQKHYEAILVPDRKKGTDSPRLSMRSQVRALEALRANWDVRRVGRTLIEEERRRQWFAVNAHIYLQSESVTLDLPQIEFAPVPPMTLAASIDSLSIQIS